MKHPKVFTEVQTVETCSTYDRITCVDGTGFTCDIGFCCVGELVRVRRGRAEVAAEPQTL